MTARSYIEKKFSRRYRNNLLRGLGSYLRRVKEIDHSEYTIEKLVDDFKSGVVKNQKGVGKITLQQLESQLGADGYL